MDNKPRALRCIKYTIQYNLFFQKQLQGKKKKKTPDNSGLRAENSLLIVGEEINIHFPRTEGLPFQGIGRIACCEVNMAATKYICSKINFKKKVKPYVTNRLNGWDSESTVKKQTNKQTLFSAMSLIFTPLCTSVHKTCTICVSRPSQGPGCNQAGPVASLHALRL